jgi:hypothetical protein
MNEASVVIGRDGINRGCTVDLIGNKRAQKAGRLISTPLD